MKTTLYTWRNDPAARVALTDHTLAFLRGQGCTIISYSAPIILDDYRRTGNADAARDAGLTTPELLIAPSLPLAQPATVIRDVLTWHGHGFDEVRGWRITEPFESRCERLIVDGEPVLVVFSEPTDEFNQGASITNSIEYIATLTLRKLPELLERANVAKETVRWFQYYGYARIRRQEYPLQYSLTEVTFAWSPGEKRFTSTQWQPIADMMLLAKLKKLLRIT